MQRTSHNARRARIARETRDLPIGGDPSARYLTYHCIHSLEKIQSFVSPLIIQHNYTAKEGFKKVPPWVSLLKYETRKGG